ncbi:MAG TPA: ABC transporter ATP-binding protein [Thermomicrobiales bacterium]|nr:ABC transporter ATP-binding protein [Thermomicrobiales bacterium]
MAKSMQNVDPDDLLGKAYDGRVARRLLSFVRPYKRRVLLLVLAAVTAITCDLLLPWLFSRAIDEVRPDGPRRAEMLNLLGLAFLGALALRFLAMWGQFYTTSWLGNRVVYDLRNTMFRHLQTLSLNYIDKRGVGAIMTRIQNDVAVINEMFADGLLGIFSNVLILVGIVFVMLLTDWQLALLAFIAMPIMILVMKKWRVRAVETYRTTRRTISAVNANLAESIAGMRVMQAFGREEGRRKRFQALNHANLVATVDAARLGALLLPIVILIGATAVVVVLFAGGRLVFNTEMTLGELTLFIVLVDRFFEPIRDLSQQYNTMQASMAAGERIFEVLDVEPDVRDKPDAKPLPPIKGAVRYDNVRFGYGPTEILHGINLSVEPGETVAFVGETGAGKSSMINLLMRFYDVWDGAITIDGYDLRDVTQDSLRSQVGMVLQDTFLFGGTVRDNIRFARPDASDEAVERAARDVGAHEFISKLPEGYDTPVQERGLSLSVGQRQLLSFARALLADPRILILDEATSSIDTQTERIIQVALHRLLQGRTSFVIAHRLSTIREADKVVVLDQGRIIEQGTHEELLAHRGVYFQLHAMQWRGEEQAAD